MWLTDTREDNAALLTCARAVWRAMQDALVERAEGVVPFITTGSAVLNIAVAIFTAFCQ
jgi:hypothetical protein